MELCGFLPKAATRGNCAKIVGQPFPFRTASTHETGLAAKRAVCYLLGFSKHMPLQEQQALTPTGRFIMHTVAALYLLVFAAICLAIAAIVAWACRSLDLPTRIGDKWVFIPALVPLPFTIFFSWVTRPRRLGKAVRRYLEKKGYAAN
jgi:hypothetical protein